MCSRLFRIIVSSPLLAHKYTHTHTDLTRSLIPPRSWLNELKTHIYLPISSTLNSICRRLNQILPPNGNQLNGALCLLCPPTSPATLASSPSLIPAISSFRRSRQTICSSSPSVHLPRAHTRSFARSLKGDTHCCFCTRARIHRSRILVY